MPTSKETSPVLCGSQAANTRFALEVVSILIVLCVSAVDIFVAVSETLYNKAQSHKLLRAKRGLLVNSMNHQIMQVRLKTTVYECTLVNESIS